MAEYPDWVMEHKKKGTYINAVNGRYYLYAAHSERIKGTNKVRRVSDGYLGRITQEEGFIPAKRKLEDTIYVFEYGLSAAILQLCKNIREGLKKEFGVNSDYVFTRGLMIAMPGGGGKMFYEASWLSQTLPKCNFEKEPSQKEQAGIERVKKMITYTLEKHFGIDGYEMALNVLPLIKMVRMGKEEKLAHYCEEIASFLECHNIEIHEEG